RDATFDLSAWSRSPATRHTVATLATGSYGPSSTMPPMLASTRPGMGANPYSGGVAFRVSAPFARGVAVAGTFNARSLNRARLDSEGSGYRCGDVAGASAGDAYKFVIVSGAAGEVLWKNDPYARSMTNEAGNGIVTDPGTAPLVDGYSTPPWNQLVIYEL